MTEVLEASKSRSIDAGFSDDTAEFELSAEQRRELLDAADEGEAVGSRGAADKNSASMIWRRTARIDFACNLMFAGAVLLFVGIGVARVVSRDSTTPAAATTARLADHPFSRAQAERPGVRVKNPFDATEVFEFPADTSVEDAHLAVADLLLERGRERFGPGIPRK